MIIASIFSIAFLLIIGAGAFVPLLPDIDREEDGEK